METIYKYPLVITGSQEVLLPKGASVLSVGVQHDTICIWALVDPTEPFEPQHLRIFGTGQPIPEDPDELLLFLGTVLTGGGRFVWHVFLDCAD
jgi:hypothetical protein